MPEIQHSILFPTIPQHIGHISFVNEIPREKNGAENKTSEAPTDNGLLWFLKTIRMIDASQLVCPPSAFLPLLRACKIPEDCETNYDTTLPGERGDTLRRKRRYHPDLPLHVSSTLVVCEDEQ